MRRRQVVSGELPHHNLQCTMGRRTGMTTGQDGINLCMIESISGLAMKWTPMSMGKNGLHQSVQRTSLRGDPATEYSGMEVIQGIIRVARYAPFCWNHSCLYGKWCQFHREQCLPHLQVVIPLKVTIKKGYYHSLFRDSTLDDHLRKMEGSFADLSCVLKCQKSHFLLISTVKGK